MFRTIMASIVAIIAAVIIGAFRIVGVSLTDIQGLVSSGDVVGQLTVWGAALFQQLLRPYTAATQASPSYAPIVALGVAGFVAGLISKSHVRVFFVSVISLVAFFIGYVALSLAAPIALPALQAAAEAIAIDLAVSFALLFVPGVIGAQLTAEEY